MNVNVRAGQLLATRYNINTLYKYFSAAIIFFACLCIVCLALELLDVGRIRKPTAAKGPALEVHYTLCTLTPHEHTVVRPTGECSLQIRLL